MRYVQLRAFHNVAVHGGFSRAAEALFVTQPAISDQVRKLEREYDVLLFDRQKRRVALTRQGQKLLEITNRLFETERQAEELLSLSRALRAGKLKIVADSVVHILPVLSRFRAEHPGVQIEVSVGNSEEIREKLRTYQADAGVLGEVPETGEFEAVKLSSTRLVAYVSRAHELSGRTSMTLGEIVAYPLVLRERGSKTRQIFEEIARERGLNINPIIAAEGRGAVSEIVAGGVGVGIISRAEFGDNSRLKSIEIADCDIVMDEAVICLRERRGSRLIEAFMALAGRPVSKPGAPSGAGSGERAGSRDAGARSA